MKRILITAALVGVFATAQTKNERKEGSPEAIPNNSKATLVSPPPASKHSILYSLDSDYRLDGARWENEHLVRYTYLINDDYKMTVRLSFWSDYEKSDTDGKFGFNVKHQFLQTELYGPTFAEIAGFKTRWYVRASLPTSNSAQEAGSYGAISPRLLMEQKFNNSFNLTVIPKVSLNIQRNGYPIRGGKPDSRNDLVRLGIEIVPQWVIIPDVLTLSYDLDLGGTYKGNSYAGDKNFLVEGDFNQEIELMYTIKSAGNLGIGAIVENDGLTFGNHAEMKIFKTGETFIGGRLNKNFDL